MNEDPTRELPKQSFEDRVLAELAALLAEQAATRAGVDATRLDLGDHPVHDEPVVAARYLDEAAEGRRGVELARLGDEVGGRGFDGQEYHRSG